MKWLSRIALAGRELNETVTDSVDLPAPLAITCRANLNNLTAGLFRVGVFEDWQGGPFMVQLLISSVVGWLGWLCSLDFSTS